MSSSHQEMSVEDGARLNKGADTSLTSAPKGFYLPDAMRRDLQAAVGLARSETTKRHLMIAGAEVIQENGFGGLKVAEVCRRAGFAHGTFYLHWKDRRGIAYEVLTTFMAAIRAHRPRRVEGQSFYERLLVGHLYYIDLYRQNVGLMRCQSQLADELDEFAALSIEANVAMARRVIRAAENENPRLAAEPLPRRLATALSCISMVDKLLHDVFARGLELGLDDEELAASLSLSWHRALLGCDP